MSARRGIERSAVAPIQRGRTPPAAAIHAASRRNIPTLPARFTRCDRGPVALRFGGGCATLNRERGLQPQQRPPAASVRNNPTASLHPRFRELEMSVWQFARPLPDARFCGLNRLCENSKTLFLQNEKGVVGTLAARQNAPYRICGGRFFGAEHRRGVFTQPVKAVLRSLSLHRSGLITPHPFGCD